MRHEDTQRSKGWGLITFNDTESALRCVTELNGSLLCGRSVHLRADRSLPVDNGSSTYNVFVGNLPWSVSNDDLMTLFIAFRPQTCQLLTNMYGKSRGFGLLKFEREDDAQHSIDAMNGQDVAGRVIECRFDRGPGKIEDTSPRCSVFVGQLGLDLEDADLGALFSHVGLVVSAEVSRYAEGKSRGWGIVNFADPAAAKKAVDTMVGGLFKVRLDRK
mmetsp:Transcript_29165/g.64757  ORF Transcript_29165/g.64757 Transcript_29165/m.64757 type:complete len:217 (-) Transcript_29165:127-777(-)